MMCPLLVGRPLQAHVHYTPSGGQIIEALHPNFRLPEDDLLADAAAVMAERGADYGPPSDHHSRTAQAVNAILGTDLTPRDVAVFFVVDKLVRARTSPGKRDHYLDAAAYIRIAWDHQRDL